MVRVGARGWIVTPAVWEWVWHPVSDLAVGDLVRVTGDEWGMWDTVTHVMELHPDRGLWELNLGDDGYFVWRITDSVERWERVDAGGVKRSGGCFHGIAREDESRWQRWRRVKVQAWRHRKCGGVS